MKSILSFCTAVLALGVAGGVSAQTKTWNFGDGTAPGSCSDAANANAGNMGNKYGCTEQPGGTVVNLEVKSYGNTGAGATFAAANTAYWGTGSGFGVRNATEGLSVAEPDHAMDNNGSQDLLMLKFTGAGTLALNSLQLGWTQNDSDVSILRWAGAGAPETALTGATVGTLAASGWSWVANLSNIGTGVASFNTGVGAVSSSYWIVAAYNTSFDGAAYLDATTDYMKVLAVAGNVTGGPGGATGVPEPTSLALLAAAALGGLATRRRWLKRG